MQQTNDNRFSIDKDIARLNKENTNRNKPSTNINAILVSHRVIENKFITSAQTSIQ